METLGIVLRNESLVVGWTGKGTVSRPEGGNTKELLKKPRRRREVLVQGGCPRVVRSV